MKKDYILILFFLIMSFSYGQDKSPATSLNDSVNKMQEIRGLEIFPNPVSAGIVRVNTFENAEKTVHIYDVLGKQVFFIRTKKNLINVSRLKSGVYIIRVSEQGNTATRKLIIK